MIGLTMHLTKATTCRALSSDRMSHGGDLCLAPEPQVHQLRTSP